MILRFEPFTFQPEPPALWRDGRPVHLRPQAMAVLTLLLREPGRFVTRDALRQQIRGGADDQADDQEVHELVREVREALGDDPDSARFVETAPHHGYRFVAPVEEVVDSAAARRGWLLRMALIVAAMVVVPGVLYRLTIPAPVRVSVAPPPTGAPVNLVALVDRLAPALSDRPSVTFVAWDREDTRRPDLVLEVDPPTGRLGETAVEVRLVRWPERAVVWTARVAASHPDSLALEVARAVARVVTGARQAERAPGRR